MRDRPQRADARAGCGRRCWKCGLATALRGVPSRAARPAGLAQRRRVADQAGCGQAGRDQGIVRARRRVFVGAFKARGRRDRRQHARHASSSSQLLKESSRRKPVAARKNAAQADTDGNARHRRRAGPDGRRGEEDAIGASSTTSQRQGNCRNRSSGSRFHTGSEKGNCSRRTRRESAPAESTSACPAIGRAPSTPACRSAVASMVVAITETFQQFRSCNASAGWRGGRRASCSQICRRDRSVAWRMSTQRCSHARDQ
jgi:hypothetical protein